MYLYTYVSIAVVVLTTSVLYLLFRKNNLKDFRYYLGLGISAGVAITASLFLPNMVSAISRGLALQFAIAFFVALLFYITLLFLIMVLLASIIPQKRVDKLKDKWNQWKLEKKNAKEQKRIEKAEKNRTNSVETSLQASQGEKQDPTLKNIFIQKFTNKKPDNTLKEPDNDIQKENGEASFDSGQVFVETVSSLEKSLENTQNLEKNVDTPDIIDKMGIDMNTNSQASELDLHEEEASVDALIERAFSLKREGRQAEAASIYISVLDKKPDDEVVFWIVVDICEIYKKAGKAELAEDILLTYMDEYENLMSEEVKEQILQSLYA